MILVHGQQFCSTECKKAPALTWRQAAGKLLFCLFLQISLGITNLQQVCETVTVLVLVRKREIGVGRKIQLLPYPWCSESICPTYLWKYLQIFLLCMRVLGIKKSIWKPATACNLPTKRGEKKMGCYLAEAGSEGGRRFLADFEKLSKLSVLNRKYRS